MTAWRIWRAGSDDEEAVISLETLAFAARSWGAESVRGSFTAARVSVLLAGAPDAAPVGFAMWRDLGSEAELLSIGVLPEARGKGAGAALLKAVVYEARRAGAARLYLEVDAGAEAACALYRKAGFKEVSVRRGYYRDGADAVVMQTTL